MRVRVRHESRYTYDEPALLGPQLVRLRPAEHTRARVLSYNLAFTPEGEVRWQHDPWGNRIARLTFPAEQPSSELAVIVDAAFEIRPLNPFDFFVDDRCRELPFSYPDELGRELGPFLASAHARPGPRLARWLEEVPQRGYITDYLVALNQRVADNVRYIIRDEPGIQSSEETLERRSGSCRDSALLLCDALRAHGFAARFVSGYLVQLADEGNIPDMAKGVDRDVVDLHAWCEVYVPGAGWIGLDGTSGLLTGEGHIPLACTVAPALAAPIDGTSSVGAARVSFSVTVARIGHEPRPRRPYTDEAWSAIRAAGRDVDAALTAAGLCLTMGGEPTWTSREHPRAPEWNLEALGPTKWDQGLCLARELMQRLPPGLLAMQRMGKLYPGESLPRWVLELVWRGDGVPVWQAPSLLDLAAPADDHLVKDDAAPERLALARELCVAIADRLAVPPELVAGHEDPWVAIMREMNLPDDVDPLAAELDDPEERRTLARVLTRGLGAAVGFALPLGRSGGGWTSDRWTFRRGAMFLVPGDSPMGLRLPLERLGGVPWPTCHEDTTSRREPFAFVPPRMQTRGERETRSTSAPAALGYRVTTALCVEPRSGAMCVFLPPCPSAEDFLALVSAVEAAAAELSIAVRLEGYPPPADPRLRSCAITPDPGVIEVNLPPAASFDDYVTMLETVADAANHAGLSTEKYQLDGREVGSGGGHHLTLGGPTTIDSPFLQRPELLAGLLRYLQNHPALSFLFTGLFVGPTSQAPRIDEARHDALGELEIALARAEAAVAPPPWLTDRLFRNLLADVAGNTHRTEICIDKLYDPWTLSGRQGLIELRAFEMPPHVQMAAAQMLLVRALSARLARAAYRQPLVRWGTALHDRFLLPHYLWSDFRDVVSDLGAHGIGLDEAWYRPFLDHRCPLLGRLELDNVALELRSALEPWPVLGEQPGSHGGTSRYVDSSLERLEVRAFGMTPGRHRVAVNGLLLPLVPTGTASEEVGGVRFRAWQPPEALHPEIGIHHPLRFDVVDTWAKRSLGACTHHVWHPEGRGFEDPPLTAFEAAARRAQRFSTEGHAPWPVELIPAEPHPDHPYTLDLRLYPLDRRMPPTE
jgi:uncharacterized protein (DUF2126 family)/transglutaminase-like putative cysteine protease